MKKLNFRLKEILNALADGQYEIQYENECDCVLEYDNRYSDHLQTALSFGCGNECWHGKILYIKDSPIDSPIAYVTDCEQTRQLEEKRLTEEDIPEELWKKLVDYPDENVLHEERKRETIIAWIEENKYIPYRIDGGFANRFDLYLVTPENVKEWEKDDRAYQLSAQEWVDDFLRYPDEITQSFVTAQMG